ncbi:hypothetical protein CANARDRAFT_201426 [[Candida] arabinofermentans NRRL YB-2248]|uniref:Calcium-binding protein NCS-1 n=1 Tax=[Candida] arabinofermentans NRRL YB-2248 TaxID=983967 RepID=A0A1E4SX95_9ASCO|nr:hypothetical protein CANARDRAFT_201426 [[Candida] arabinofermentans NRRL YB-2248]
MGQKTSKLNKEDLTTLKSETRFSARELQQWYKGFKRDVPTGQLTKEEFIKIHKQFYPFGDPIEFSNYAFEAFDTENNGHISFKNFIISLSLASRGSLQEKLTWSFPIYDRDKDGSISYDDLLTVLKSIYKMVGSSSINLEEDEQTPESRAKKIWEKFGKDINIPDQFITMDEFVQYKNLEGDVTTSLNIYNDLI